MATSWIGTRRQTLAVFSNAAIQWLPDHQEFIPRVWSLLTSGGCLAVQVPVSWDLPSHQVIRDTLNDTCMDGECLGSHELRLEVSRRPVHDSYFYFDLLSSESVCLDVWSTDYIYILEGQDAVLEWVTGTSMRPILNALDKKERNTYLDIVRRRLGQLYPMRSDGTTVYSF